MGSILRRSLVERQDIQPSAITHGKILDHTLGSQEFGTCEEIIIYGTQIKDDIIGSEHIQSCAISYGTQIINDLIGSEHIDAGAIAYATQIKDDIIVAAHILDHSLGSQHLGTTVAIIVEGTQIEDDLIGSEHIANAAVSYATQIKDSIITGAKIVDDAIGSEHIEAVGISYAAQIKGKIITPEKFNELYLHGTVAAVTGGGAYILFGTNFSGTPDLVISPENVGVGTFPFIETKTRGSALVKLSVGGTVVCDYIAMGAW
jgi:hypothetical protein